MPEPARRGSRRSWPQRLLISFNLCLVVAALVCAASLGYLNAKVSKLKRVKVGQALTTASAGTSGPQNFLLVGTDSDTGLGAKDPAVQGRGDVTGTRSDTMMILRVDPSSSHATLLSIPRDLWVNISGTDTESKINSAIELGGPKLLIKTIEDNLGIPINHYVEIDFAGFKKLVKAVGGVPIYFNVPVRDAEFCSSPGYNGCNANGVQFHSVLNIPKAGCYTLEPDEALAYARSRYFQYYEDGEWHSDPNGDLGRISRQQDFVRAALKRALSKAIHDPLKLNSVLNASIGAVTVDNKLATGDLFNLGRRFRSFDPNNLKTIEIPVVDHGDGSSVDVNEAAAAPILAMFKGQASSGSSDTSGVTVQVLNGSGEAGQAGTVTEGLAKAGFSTQTAGTEVGGATDSTVIRYASGSEAAAKLVARYLDGPITYQTSSTVQVGTVEVITATSLNGVASHPKADSDVPDPPSASTSTSVGSPSSGSSGPGSTATTVVGFVPNHPPSGVSCG